MSDGGVDISVCRGGGGNGAKIRLFACICVILFFFIQFIESIEVTDELIKELNVIAGTSRLLICISYRRHKSWDIHIMYFYIQKSYRQL